MCGSLPSGILTSDSDPRPPIPITQSLESRPQNPRFLEIPTSEPSIFLKFCSSLRVLQEKAATPRLTPKS